MELRQYFAIVRKWWWLLALTTLLATGTAYYVSSTAPLVYRATATLQIDRGGDPRDDPTRVIQSSEAIASTYVVQIQSTGLLQEVKTRLGVQMSVGKIEEMLTVSQVADTRLINITAEGHDPIFVKALVDMVAQVFIERETESQEARYQARLSELESQVAALEADIEETQKAIAALGDQSELPEFARLELARLESQRTNQQTRLMIFLQSAEEFRLAMARYTTRIDIFEPAELPGEPVGPEVLQTTGLAAVTGLMIGAGVAFLLEYLDDTIKTPLDARRALGIHVLGGLPRHDDKGPLVTVEHPQGAISEAFRKLRTSIQFADLDHPMRTLLVTSPMPTDGKSFVATNLAVAIAQSGKSVILVDSDLRHPVQHRAFDLPKYPGLREGLIAGQDVTGERGENEAVVPPDLLQATGVEDLHILTAGERTPNPAEVLGSQTFQRFAARLTEQADYVIFDSPPVLAVTDAVVLSHMTDGVILVLDCGQTRIPAAAQAMERLREVGSRVLGAVLNRVPASGDGYYYYYQYYYGGEDEGAQGWLDGLLGKVWPRKRRSNGRGR